MQKVKKILKLYNWLQNAIAETKIKDLIKIRPVVPEKNAKKWRKFWKGVQLAVEFHSINKNQRFDQDQTSSSWEKCQKVKKICETLQLTAECHSMNKNQCLMKTSSSSEKCKKLRKFWNFTIDCRVPQHEQKSKIWSR